MRLLPVFRGFDRYRAGEVGRWLGGQTGGPPVPFEKVEPGDEEILPERERRELDALPSGLDRGE